NILIGERTAEQVKINVGSALSELDNAPDDYSVLGRDLMSGHPKEVIVTYSEIAGALDKSITKIEDAIHTALNQTPPELSADIFRTGIYLAGGGALLRGLDKRISLRTKLPVHIADDPLHAVAKGTAIALKNIDRFPFLMRN
ncbi:MAG TPA: rod shape-determining protein, partial [Flavobacteriales bacterium]|nr:rod shape-determining protein [Flavobacteriales bacterium]